MSDDQHKCIRCGKCCQSIIVPFSCGGDYGDYLLTHGCTVIPGRGTLIPSRCIHLKEIKKAGKKLDGSITPAMYKCDIYDRRPAMCHHELFEHYNPEGCNEVG